MIDQSVLNQMANQSYYDHMYQSALAQLGMRHNTPSTSTSGIAPYSEKIGDAPEDELLLLLEDI